MENTENTNYGYKPGDIVWVKYTFISSKEFQPDKNNLIWLKETVNCNCHNPFYIYEINCFGIITEIYIINDWILLTLYCKTYIFCHKNTGNPEFGSLKFYVGKEGIRLKRKLTEEEKKLYKEEIEALYARLRSYYKRYGKLDKIFA